MQLDLRLYPDPVLTEICVPIEPTNPEVAELAHEMCAELIPWKAAGLAAPQVGYSWQLFVMRINEQSVICVNPSIDPKSGKLLLEDKEGCLSVPDVIVKVVRWNTIELQYQDLQGRKHFLPLTGFGARVAQHEYEHLQGRTILDHLSGKRLERTLERYNAQQGL
jgi:peptide deformylase